MEDPVYADTSFWVSLYVLDANSTRARRLVRKNHPCLLTRIVEHELRNAIRLGVFRNQITSAQSDASLAVFESDLKTTLVETASIAWDRIFRRAEALSQEFTALQGQRATDILHVASALELGVSRFVTFDKRQAQLAKSVGLKLVS